MFYPWLLGPSPPPPSSWDHSAPLHILPVLRHGTCSILKDRETSVNSLAPEGCGTNFKSIISKLIIQNSGKGTHCEIAPRWMPLNLTNGKSTLAQEWLGTIRQQAITWNNVDRHPYSISRSQWVNHGKLSASLWIICLTHCGLET